MASQVSAGFEVIGMTMGVDDQVEAFDVHPVIFNLRSQSGEGSLMSRIDQDVDRSGQEDAVTVVLGIAFPWIKIEAIRDLHYVSLDEITDSRLIYHKISRKDQTEFGAGQPYISWWRFTVIWDRLL